MKADNTAVRTIHDLTQAAWFGGSLMGAVAIRAASRAAADGTTEIAVADAAWAAWHRVRNPTLIAHLAAGAALTAANKGRLAGQRGALATTLLRTAATGMAIASEITAQVLGSRLSREATGQGSTPPPSGPPSSPEAQGEAVQALHRRLRRQQWVTVALTGAVIALGAHMGEQQRPTNVLRGALSRLGVAA